MSSSSSITIGPDELDGSNESDGIDDSLAAGTDEADEILAFFKGGMMSVTAFRAVVLTAARTDVDIVDEDSEDKRVEADLTED
jgi:hypothetical protein